MECDFLSQKMRRPPPIFRGLLSPLDPIPTATSILCQNKPHIFPTPLLFPLRLHLSSCASMKIADPSTDSTFCDFGNPPLQLNNGSMEMPRGSYSSRNCTISNSSGNIYEANRRCRTVWNVNMWDSGDIVEIDNKRRLKLYSEMLRNCALNGSLNDGKAIHGQVIKNGIDPDVHLWVSLINFYAKIRSLSSARQVLDEMPERDVVAWTALITGFVAEGYSSNGVNAFCEMRKEGIRPNEFTFATGLKACSMSLDLDFGKQIHSEVLKAGAFSDIYVGSALVDLYAKCSEMDYAKQVFLFMPEQNAVSWNALLNGFAQMGDGEEVLKLLRKMKKSEMKFSKFTLSTLLKGFANSGSLKAGQVVHSMAIKLGCELDEYISCSLVDLYSKCGLANDALNVFVRIKNPDIVMWSAMISCLDQQGQKQQAAELFRLMRLAGLRPNQFTLATLVSTTTNLGDLRYGEASHACICKFGFESDSLVSNVLIILYMKYGSVQASLQVFETIHHHDSASWNALLSGFHGIGTFDQGPIIFHQMLLGGFKPDIYTFICILGCCSSLSNIGFGKQVHTHVVKNGLDDNSNVGTALMDMYMKSRCSEDAGVVFKRLNERDLVTWTVMIGNYAQNGQWREVFKCFTQMQREDVEPNEFTLSSCLSGCSGLETLENGRQLHSLVVKAGMSGHTYVSTSLIDMYSQCRCIEDAEAIFKSMTKRNSISWNTLICGYSQNGEGEKALEAFRSMLDEGHVPDEVTFIGVLSACSHMGMIEEGKEHFDSLSKVYGITPTIEHHACMVTMLCRAGKFCEVENFIKTMNLTQNASIWETVLWASKMHGNVEFGQKAAEKLFVFEPEIGYNYILLSDIFAAKGMWDDVAEVRALMSRQGIKKDPGCSMVELDAQAHMFFAQDYFNPKIKEVCLQLGKLARLESV